MWVKIALWSMVSMLLTACNINREPPPADGSGNLCQILREQLETQVYKDHDENTMKRKNVGDQARLIQEYESYDCLQITGPVD